MSIVFATQVRMGSSRLPGKVLLPIGEKRIIEWVLHQANIAATTTTTIITIGDGSENAAITEWADRNGYEYLVGPEKDLLTRYQNIIKEKDCSLLIRVTGDCPFVPPSEVDRVVEAHKTSESTYTTNRTPDMPIGTAVDVLEPTVLTQLPDDLDHPVKPMLDNPQEWRVNFTKSHDWEKYGGVHMSVDTPSDYWTLIDAVEETGGDPELIAQWIANQDVSNKS
jgi:spore coat polysaccharide biosynthesis protein SpsF